MGVDASGLLEGWDTPTHPGGTSSQLIIRSEDGPVERILEGHKPVDKKCLHVHDLVLEANPDGSPYISGDRVLAIFIELDEFSPDSFLVTEYLLNSGPLIRDLRVGMTMIWVIDIGIYASFEDGMVECWLCRGQLGHFAELNIQEGRNVPQVEDAGVAQLDRLVKQLLIGQHALRDGIPAKPKVLPVIERWERCLSILRRLPAELHGGGLGQ
ncbi:hypothetical protein PG991_005811 [Apiospora marii]|uniref:Uncharacterized protein n=1 Tax=Apiospora marii TaxID=335849 RepID=A0ABR1SBJ3_9PEZI